MPIFGFHRIQTIDPPNQRESRTSKNLSIAYKLSPAINIFEFLIRLKLLGPLGLFKIKLLKYRRINYNPKR